VEAEASRAASTPKHTARRTAKTQQTAALAPAVPHAYIFSSLEISREIFLSQSSPGILPVLSIGFFRSLICSSRAIQLRRRPRFPRSSTAWKVLKGHARKGDIHEQVQAVGGALDHIRVHWKNSRRGE
jgi:hypothetical protein